MSESFQFTIQHLLESWHQLSKCLSKNPDKLINSYLNYNNMDLSFINNHHFNLQDKRFLSKEWSQNISSQFLKNTYLYVSEHLNQITKKITANENVNTKRIQFFIEQILNASSPSNFLMTNPELISTTLTKKGINLTRGMQNFFENLENGKGLLAPNNSDLNAFILGKNIACTKGKIIFQNKIMQLIQYEPTTKKIFDYPLLIIPPWINKYYILDLQNENSFVKWLVSKGVSVFMISWVNPNKTHKDLQFSDYLVKGPLSALKQIKKLTSTKKINLLGYCIGGTLLGCFLSYLNKKNDSSIKSATFLTTLFDFKDPGELSAFIDDEQISSLEKHMEKRGFLEGEVMASVFNLLRANDLIWSSFVSQYLKGEKPKPFDLLFWNADSTNIPNKVHRFYLRKMYLENVLIKPDGIKLAGTPINLKRVKVPSYFLAASDDHIVPWQSCYNSLHFYGGPSKFVLTLSGHVAGVINPPYKNKYGYYTNKKKPNQPDKYLSTAAFHKGSWWNDWLKWLKSYSGEKLPLDYYHNQCNEIEEAPGSYIKVKINDCN